MLHNKRDMFKPVPADPKSADHLTADQLSDRAALTDLLTTFAQALDARDWAGYRSVFTSEIELDYSSWRPENIGRWNADEWVARAAGLFPGFTYTRHALTDITVTLDGDRATVGANLCADHAIVDGDDMVVFTLHGHYDDRCVRTPEGWLISAKRLVVHDQVGDIGVMHRARQRAAELAGNG